MNSRTEALLAMLERGQESALLRYSLGNEFLNADDPQTAIEHLRRATELDPHQSAAWKLLGKAFAATGQLESAIETFNKGIETATVKGDRQAAKEMQVFRRRAEKARTDG